MTLNNAIVIINNTLAHGEMKVFNVSQLLADLFQEQASRKVTMSRGEYSLGKQTFDVVFSGNGKCIASTFKIEYERGQGEVLGMMIKSVSLPKKFEYLGEVTLVNTIENHLGIEV